MSLDRKRTEIVYEIARGLVAGGRAVFRSGDVCSVLRDRNQPLSAWQVRGEFHTLKEQGLIQLNSESGDWRLTGDAMADTQSTPVANAG